MALYYTLNYWLTLTIIAVCFVIEFWALLNALRHPAARYEAAFKWKKQNWLLVLALTAIFGLVGPFILNLGMFFTMLLVTPAGVFLADVAPALGGRRHW